MQFLIDIGLSIVYFCIFLLLCAWSWRFWKMYVNQKFLNSLDWVLLEIKLPREIDKSPYATEIALAALLQSGGVGNKYAIHFEGKLPSYFSLEIASLEGVVHFYIRTQKKFRPLIESNFYAQYPGIEIIEADDYTKLIRYHHLSKDVSLWGMNYRPSKTWTPINPKTGEPWPDNKMKADFLPIKTYVDYGLDKDPKEEYKIDPLAQVIEMLGGLTKGQYMWYQILVLDESVYNDKKFPKFYVNEANHKHMNLSEMAEQYKKQLRTSGYIKHGDVVYDAEGNKKTKSVKTDEKDAEGKPIFKEVDVTHNLIKNPKDTPETVNAKAISKKETELTPEEKDELEAVNKKFAKPLALVSMRLVYIAKKESYNTAHIQGTLAMPKPFAGWNSFAPAAITDPYDYPWQRYGGKRPAWRGEELFEAYVERAGFFPHVTERDSLDSWEDRFFWSSTMRARKTFRMFYEILFHPFEHPSAEDIVFTLNLEELATLWHLPGQTVATPTLPRIDSTKGVAPVNLPL